MAAQCEQPTAQVLGAQLGYTDLSHVDGGGTPTFLFPRGPAVGGSAQKNTYVGKVTNSWLLGGPKYIQYRECSPDTLYRAKCPPPLAPCPSFYRRRRRLSSLGATVYGFCAKTVVAGLFREYATNMGCVAASTSTEFKPLPFMPEQYILTDCVSTVAKQAGAS